MLWPVVSMACLRAREQDVHLAKKSQSSRRLECGFFTTETRQAPGTAHGLARPLPSSRWSPHPDLIISPEDTTTSAQTNPRSLSSKPTRHFSLGRLQGRAVSPPNRPRSAVRGHLTREHPPPVFCPDLGTALSAAPLPALGRRRRRSPGPQPPHRRRERERRRERSRRWRCRARRLPLTEGALCHPTKPLLCRAALTPRRPASPAAPLQINADISYCFS